jgi:hypothetical protein
MKSTLADAIAPRQHGHAGLFNGKRTCVRAPTPQVQGLLERFLGVWVLMPLPPGDAATHLWQDRQALSCIEKPMACHGGQLTHQ